jgi:hypothetical protein
MDFNADGLVRRSACRRSGGWSGALKPFLQGSVFLGQLLDAALEGGVLGGDPLDGFAGNHLFEVSDA